MYITRFIEFLVENNKIHVLDYLQSNLSGDFYISLEEKINIEIKKKSYKTAIKVINSLKFRYGYYISSIIIDFYEMSEPEETKEFNNNLKEIIEKTFANNEYDEDDIAYTIVLEPKYSSMPDIIPDILYHITEKELVPKIKKYGLLPKDGNRLSVHPKRVYFALSQKECNDLLANNKFWVNNPTILTIDVSSIKNNIKFYTDINLPGGLYTDSKIPVSCIKKYEL